MCEETNTNIEKIDINELDILGRDKFLDNCKLLIDSIFETTKSAFIMIDGEWGVGKTFVMNMLDKELKNKYTILKYNCWENSYYNDPLEAILSVMLDYIDENSLWSNANKEKFRALGMIALNLLSLGSAGILNKAAEDAKEYIGEDKNSIYTVIQEVKDYINSNEEKIIILVDEIDRCLPQYGVKTLERLYLLFKDAPNIVLVIANDKSKMEMSIKNAFAYDSIDNYLEKFIDYVVKLKVDSCITDRLLLKYKSYFDSFIIDDYCEKFINSIFIYNNVRYIDKVINKAKKIHFLIFDKNTVYESYVLMLELIFTIVGKNIDFQFTYFIKNLDSSKRKSDKAILKFFLDNVIKNHSNQKDNKFVVDYKELYNKNINLYKILMWFDLCGENYFENTETLNIGIINAQASFSVDIMRNIILFDISNFGELKDIDILIKKKEYGYLSRYLNRYIGTVDDFKKFVNDSNLLLKYQLFIINLE